MEEVTVWRYLYGPEASDGWPELLKCCGTDSELLGLSLTG